ncbi:unnamed protein product [Spirodela intermedia]|uniref:Uncharacterized protein n=1 Tax=Spirodela intermedia TaxID=51605 RepID=A0A7I8IP37_SPIIN|nr:unnamed protein product [Spirodela intermedia]CAA6659628.1 unnamed protein product [Spirodela intermedia]
MARRNAAAKTPLLMVALLLVVAAAPLHAVGEKVNVNRCEKLCYAWCIKKPVIGTPDTCRDVCSHEFVIEAAKIRVFSVEQDSNPLLAHEVIHILLLRSAGVD